jgi:hypothetical protein
LRKRRADNGGTAPYAKEWEIEIGLSAEGAAEAGVAIWEDGRCDLCGT